MAAGASSAALRTASRLTDCGSASQQPGYCCMATASIISALSQRKQPPHGVGSAMGHLKGAERGWMAWVKNGVCGVQHGIECWFELFGDTDGVESAKDIVDFDQPRGHQVHCFH